jgi:XXXCH domain-containing protein
MGSKTERELADNGLPEFLRELAAALESGTAAGAFKGLPLDDWRKLVLVAERQDSGLAVKLKAKRAGEIRVPMARKDTRKDTHKGEHKAKAAMAPKDQDKSQASREKYRQLKKAMQVDFKALQAAASKGRLPDAEALESFLSLAELMGQGEQPVSGAALAEMVQANTTFLNDCQALRRACSERDPAALAAVLERLARRKSACHAQFR